MTHGEILASLIGLVGTLASTAALIVVSGLTDSVRSVSHRVGNIENALITRGLAVRSDHEL